METRYEGCRGWRLIGQEGEKKENIGVVEAGGLRQMETGEVARRRREGEGRQSVRAVESGGC